MLRREHYTNIYYHTHIHNIKLLQIYIQTYTQSSIQFLPFMGFPWELIALVVAK